MTISVIIPVLNESAYIGGVIDSILNQEQFSNIVEIIVVDGGSSDGTVEIVKDFILKYPIISILYNANKIVSVGFNLALNEVVGEAILRIDGHTKLPLNYLKSCISLLKKNNAEIVGGGINTLSKESGLGSAIALSQSSWFGTGGSKFRLKDSIELSYVETLAFGLHRRDLFINVGGYDEELVCNQDDEFNYRVIQNGGNILMDPNLKVQYYCRANFSDLFNQYFKYGLYKVRVIQKRNDLLSVRHLVPSVFVLVLFATLYLALFFKKSHYFMLLFIMYSMVNIISSIYVSKKNKIFHLVFLSNGILHFSYGLGFIYGLVKFFHKWKNNKVADNHFNKQKFILNSSQFL